MEWKEKARRVELRVFAAVVLYYPGMGEYVLKGEDGDI
jgi:hypothetical protein